MENLIPARKNMIDYINYVTATHASKRYFRKKQRETERNVHRVQKRSSTNKLGEDKIEAECAEK
jgi:hypothetical protein